MGKFFLVVEPSCPKKRVLTPKCDVTNIDWNYLTFSQGRIKFARDDLKLLEVVPGDGKKFQNISSRPVAVKYQLQSLLCTEQSRVAAIHCPKIYI